MYFKAFRVTLKHSFTVMYYRDIHHHFYCGYLYLSFHKIRKWLPRTTCACKWEMTVIQPNGVAAGSFSLTYAASCKIASEWTTREINDFLDKGSSKAESISPEAKRENEREMERWRRRGREWGGDTSPCAALHIICMVYTLQGPHHANDS